MDYHEVKKQKKLEKKQTGNMRKLITGSLIGINLFFGTMVPLHAGEISKSFNHTNDN